MVYSWFIHKPRAHCSLGHSPSRPVGQPFNFNRIVLVPAQCSSIVGPLSFIIGCVCTALCALPSIKQKHTWCVVFWSIIVGLGKLFPHPTLFYHHHLQAIIILLIRKFSAVKYFASNFRVEFFIYVCKYCKYTVRTRLFIRRRKYFTGLANSRRWRWWIKICSQQKFPNLRYTFLTLSTKCLVMRPHFFS